MFCTGVASFLLWTGLGFWDWNLWISTSCSFVSFIISSFHTCSFYPYRYKTSSNLSYSSAASHHAFSSSVHSRYTASDWSWTYILSLAWCPDTSPPIGNWWKLGSSCFSGMFHRCWKRTCAGSGSGIAVFPGSFYLGKLAGVWYSSWIHSSSQHWGPSSPIVSISSSQLLLCPCLFSSLALSLLCFPFFALPWDGFEWGPRKSGYGSSCSWGVWSWSAARGCCSFLLLGSFGSVSCSIILLRRFFIDTQVRLMSPILSPMLYSHPTQPKTSSSYS